MAPALRMTYTNQREATYFFFFDVANRRYEVPGSKWVSNALAILLSDEWVAGSSRYWYNSFYFSLIGSTVRGCRIHPWIQFILEALAIPRSSIYQGYLLLGLSRD